MHLDAQEKGLFFKLFFDLLYCANKKHRIVTDFGDGRYPKSVDKQKAYQIREKLFENPGWFDEYLHDYGDELPEDERGILISWRDHFIADKFFVMRNLAKYSVFMSSGDENTTRLYGITGLTHPFADFFDRNTLPVVIDALILPFKGKIIYDGLFSTYHMSIGPNMRGELNWLYKTSKEKFGIIESLPFDNTAPCAVKKTVPKKSTAKPIQQKDEKYNVIAEAMIHFCNKKLTPEFTEVCLFVLEKLRRKRPTPLSGGKANTWACGIVYAVASNNFVFDKSQPYYMTAQDIADGFGLSKSTAQSKAAEINKVLNISYLSPNYVIDSLRGHSNKMLNMIRTAEKMRRL